MVPQLVLSLIKVILLLCMPFLSLTKYDFNYVATKCGLNSDMAELVVHKWSVYLLLIYMITSKFNLFFIIYLLNNRPLEAVN